MSTRRRFEHPNHVRFLTFSCFQRLPLLSNPRIADAFASHLAAMRDRLGFHLHAWVVMPEHVHLLLWPRVGACDVPRILRAIKQPIAQQVLRRWTSVRATVLEKVVDGTGQPRFWQRGGGFDRNVFSEEELAEKFAYIHNNQVHRGLCTRPEDWRWSSARWYLGHREGEIRMDPLSRPQ